MSPRGEFVNSTLKPFPGCSAKAWARLQRNLVADADLRAARALYGDYSTDDVASSAPDGSSLGPMGWAAIALVGTGALAALTRIRRR